MRNVSPLTPICPSSDTSSVRTGGALASLLTRRRPWRANRSGVCVNVIVPVIRPSTATVSWSVFASHGVLRWVSTANAETILLPSRRSCRSTMPAAPSNCTLTTSCAAAAKRGASMKRQATAASIPLRTFCRIMVMNVSVMISSRNSNPRIHSTC